jgi:hypothetical protein
MPAARHRAKPCSAASATIAAALARTPAASRRSWSSMQAWLQGVGERRAAACDRLLRPAQPEQGGGQPGQAREPRIMGIGHGQRTVALRVARLDQLAALAGALGVISLHCNQKSTVRATSAWS